ncbi:hypothetical protein B0H11DRAFT_2024508 [Mycena galericulata]|nr:hypothetical protein B0H11DRAFT_2024508 [Mycena galericulata]
MPPPTHRFSLDADMIQQTCGLLAAHLTRIASRTGQNLHCPGFIWHEGFAEFLGSAQLCLPKRKYQSALVIVIGVCPLIVSVSSLCALSCSWALQRAEVPKSSSCTRTIPPTLHQENFVRYRLPEAADFPPFIIMARDRARAGKEKRSKPSAKPAPSRRRKAPPATPPRQGLSAISPMELLARTPPPSPKIEDILSMVQSYLEPFPGEAERTDAALKSLIFRRPSFSWDELVLKDHDSGKDVAKNEEGLDGPSKDSLSSRNKEDTKENSMRPMTRAATRLKRQRLQ